jgi:FtsP/CotA-like multicopper oxidase with cupredoxin domain
MTHENTSWAAFPWKCWIGNGIKAVEPFTRDTVLVGPRESVTIGFVPEHPGIWLTHCHIQSHAEAGMMTTTEVKE